MPTIDLAAQDFEQAKAASLLYQAGDDAYGNLGPDYPQHGIFDAACDCLFERHGHNSYAVYNGKNLAIWPNPIISATTYGDWRIRTYRDGIVDAVPTDLSSPAISPGFDSIEDAKAWLNEEYGNGNPA